MVTDISAQGEDRARDIVTLCRFWDVARPWPKDFPFKPSLDGSPVEGEEQVVRLATWRGTGGEVSVFHSVDARDILGASNWGQGWRSCLSHKEHPERSRFSFAPPAASARLVRKQARVRLSPARDACRWAAQTQGASLIYLAGSSSSERFKTQAGVTRRAFLARAWLFHLECGTMVWHAVYGNPASCFDLAQWLLGEGRTRFDLQSIESAQASLSPASVDERAVRGGAALCLPLEDQTQRIVWPGWRPARTPEASGNILTRLILSV